MQNEFDIENDNMLLKSICGWLKHDELLGYVYPLDEMLALFAMNKNIITECKKENGHREIVRLIDKILQDIQIELNKKFRKNKESIIRLLFALYSLPRVFLDSDDLLRPSCIKMEIDFTMAIEYCKSWMDASMLQTYRDYLG